ncbi:hypothetical protein DWQ65_03200 [Treponema phagedenis]|uniref:Uncharacterized protein n=2 Tax=Treponema TaxID=157 RepID=A0A0B7GZV5_TREPH|nr:hypothetical protein [Treponema phagedenis]EFW38975.1 hypothetical protein HMPREF9554_00498 [Treponema phagedenis F0421]NVP23820.1 hypothetical protein [Treponema phagedenis]NVP24922.1 hypothetical protein [Treponema phagedenis]NVP25225.1 hypothetical protein [Treponema phagedenis]NVP25430.1 hypothetical protein [Treponema phagedenis]
MSKENMDQRIVVSLRESKTKEKIEDTFKTFNIQDIQEKTAYLDEAMYSPEVFYSSGEERITPEHKYELALQMFLEGSWKLYSYYEKLGLGQENVQN